MQRVYRLLQVVHEARQVEGTEPEFKPRNFGPSTHLQLDCDVSWHRPGCCLRSPQLVYQERTESQGAGGRGEEIV